MARVSRNMTIGGCVEVFHCDVFHCDVFHCDIMMTSSRHGCNAGNQPRLTRCPVLDCPTFFDGYKSDNRSR